MKIACVTAICGGRDNLADKIPADDVAEFVCFTDDPNLTSNIWRIAPAHDEFSGRWDGHIRNAKRHKIMIHEYVECDVSLWIDGHNRLLKCTQEIVDDFLHDYDIVLYKHPARDCAYKEMETCVNEGLDVEEVMKSQLAKYEADGFPRNWGLHAGGTILRRHTEKVQAFNELWWSEVCQHSKRDQLSLDYCLWKAGLNVGYLDDYWSSEVRSIAGHRG